MMRTGVRQPESESQPTSHVATTFPGLEAFCRSELEALGVPVHSVSRGMVAFGGGTAGLYTATLWCRTALRILRPIANFRAADAAELYLKAKRIRWERWLSRSTTFAIDATLSSSIFTHSHYVALKTKDALVDRLRDRLGARPDVDIERPDLRIRIHVADTLFTVYLDAGGESLHRRGYRLQQGAAPLNEAVAAALLLAAGYTGETPLVDPFCGSGTLVVEAALIAARIAPGLLRPNHALERWTDHDPELWSRLRDDAERLRREPRAPIVGSDIEPQLIEAATRNAERAGTAAWVDLSVCDCRALVPPPGSGLVVTNPPYGVRLAHDDLEGLYRSFGDSLKRHYDGYDAWVLCGSPDLLKAIGLRADRRIPLLNGNLECRLAHFSIRGRRQDHST